MNSRGLGVGSAGSDTPLGLEYLDQRRYLMKPTRMLALLLAVLGVAAACGDDATEATTAETDAAAAT